MHPCIIFFSTCVDNERRLSSTLSKYTAYNIILSIITLSITLSSCNEAASNYSVNPNFYWTNFYAGDSRKNPFSTNPVQEEYKKYTHTPYYSNEGKLVTRIGYSDNKNSVWRRQDTRRWPKTRVITTSSPRQLFSRTFSSQTKNQRRYPTTNSLSIDSHYKNFAKKDTTNSVSKETRNKKPFSFPRKQPKDVDNNVSQGGSRGSLFPGSVSPWITSTKPTQGINTWDSKNIAGTTTVAPTTTESSSFWSKGKRRRRKKKKKPRVLNPSSEPSSVPKDSSEGDKKLITQINSLRSQLKSRYQMLQEVMTEVQDFSLKLKRMIKELRWRRLYFFDTLLLKTINYNGNSMQNLSNQMQRIDSVRKSLESVSSTRKDNSSKGSPWKTRFALKHAFESNVLHDADQVAKSTRSKLRELNEIVDDMAREKHLYSSWWITTMPKPHKFYNHW